MYKLAYFQHFFLPMIGDVCWEGSLSTSVDVLEKPEKDGQDRGGIRGKQMYNALGRENAK